MVKLFRRRGTYVGYVLVLIPVVLVSLAASHMARELQRGLGDDFVVAGNPISAAFVTRMVMVPNFVMLVPMIVAMIAGTMVAGEASTGTLRATLVRPVSRGAVLTAKFIVSWLYGVTVSLFVGGTAAAIGYIFFGGGELFALEWGPFAFVEEREAWLRLGAAYGIAAGAMLAIAAIALFVSTLTSAPWISLVVTMGAIIITPLLAAIPSLEIIHPYLLTTNLVLFADVFSDPDVVDWGKIATKGLYLGAYTAVFLAGAYVAFARKDMLC